MFIPTKIAYNGNTKHMNFFLRWGYVTTGTR